MQATGWSDLGLQFIYSDGPGESPPILERFRDLHVSGLYKESSYRTWLLSLNGTSPHDVEISVRHTEALLEEHAPVHVLPHRLHILAVRAPIGLKKQHPHALQLVGRGDLGDRGEWGCQGRIGPGARDGEQEAERSERQGDHVDGTKRVSCRNVCRLDPPPRR